MQNFDAEFNALGPNSLSFSYDRPPQANDRKKLFKVLNWMQVIIIQSL